MKFCPLDMTQQQLLAQDQAFQNNHMYRMDELLTPPLTKELLAVTWERKSLAV